MDSLPAPFNPTEKYLAAIVEQLAELNRNLAPQSLPVKSEVVELREPAQPTTKSDDAAAEEPKAAPKKRTTTRKKAKK